MKFIILNIFLAVVLLVTGCSADRSFNSRLQQTVSPYLFSIAGWEVSTLVDEVEGWLSGGQPETGDETDTVITYYNYVNQIRTLKSELEIAGVNNEREDLSSAEKELAELEDKKEALADTVESILEKQIKSILVREGIDSPVTSSNSSFPPFIFRLEKLPDLLVVSPRDRIESMRELTLKPGLPVEQKESIEKDVDRLGVSSLVTEIGGIATYPSLVGSESSLRSTIIIATEEWLHQYLVFKPLGFRYLLDVTGISRDYDITTMNETLVGIVSKEIGSLVLDEYYAGYQAGTGRSSGSGFDFNLEMREIRKTVDEYLSRGKIDQAEEFMEQKRLYLASNGYFIRKLNQAYFAFHGAYADRPAFENPIGVELRELRQKSASLSDFLDTAAAMTSRQDLAISIR
ncbi:hypothetical protein ACFLUG_01260 [Chloroflexota bacterium]